MLVSKKTVRLEHPTEEDQWIEVRLPLSAGDLELMRDGSVAGMVTFDLLAAVITNWSDPEPVSLETVKRLDMSTFAWLAKEIQSRSGIRDDEEKKDSDSNSSPTTDPAPADSPTSSGT